jgi:hypothetical protein
MKKFVVLSLIGLFVLAFGTAYAQEKEPVLEFKASGFVDTQTFWFRNISATPTSPLYGGPPATFLPGGDAFDRTNAYMDTRARLKFDALMGKALSGTIFFEMDSSRWGELTPAADQRNAMGVTSASGDRGALEIKNAYLDFGVPVIPIPITMRVGLQPIGARPQMLLTFDGMGVTMGLRPVDPLTIGLIWSKYYEGDDFNADDDDLYAVTAALKIATLTVGGELVYMNMNEYPVGTIEQHRADFYWLGAYLDGKLGPVNVNLDFIYDTGEVETRLPGVRDVDYSGWIARAYVDFPWEKFNFGAKFLYATGSDTEETSPTGLPGSLTSLGTPTTDVDGWVIPPTSEAFGAFGESIIVYGSWVDSSDQGMFHPTGTQVGRGSPGGTWFASLYGAAKIMPEWKTTFAAYYIGDTTDNGNTFGTAREVTGRPEDEDFIGIEVNWINEFQIYKNLKYTIGFGWLFAGDAMDHFDAATGTNESMDDPWGVFSNITYSF